LDTLKSREESGLSDKVYEIKDFNADRLISGLFYNVLGQTRAFDFFKNGCIFKRRDDVGGDNYNTALTEHGCDCYLENGCPGGKLISPKKDIDMNNLVSFDKDGMPILNVDALFNDDGTIDDEDIDMLNESLNTLPEDMDNFIKFLDDVGGDTSDQEELQKNIEEFKEYSLFYVLQDKEDNDGDGCIDEEIMFNGKTFDADGDGLTGEDSRFVPSNCWRLKNDISTSCDKYNGSLPYECIYDPNDCKSRIPIHPYEKRQTNDYFIMTVGLNENGIKDTLNVVYYPATQPGFWSGDYSDKEKKRENHNAGNDLHGFGGCWGWLK
jgi:hypothetical protein